MIEDDYREHVAKQWGELHTQYSTQYKRPVIVPCGETDVDKIIKHARHMGATYDEGDGVELFVVVLRPDVGPELWSEIALRKSAQ